jgi:hypothetical protein
MAVRPESSEMMVVKGSKTMAAKISTAIILLSVLCGCQGIQLATFKPSLSDQEIKHLAESSSSSVQGSVTAIQMNFEYSLTQKTVRHRAIGRSGQWFFRRSGRQS